MSDNERKLTLSDVEEIVNEFAQKYAWDAHGVPHGKIRVVLWPTDKYVWSLTAGITAIVRIGRLPGDPIFNKAMRAAIDHAVARKAWESTEIVRVVDLVRREEEMKRIQRERYNFDSDLLPGLLHDEEVSVAYITRVEVTHRKTGQREVVEFKQGQGNIWASKQVAIARLSRVIREAERQKLGEEKADIDDPNWVAITA